MAISGISTALFAAPGGAKATRAGGGQADSPPGSPAAEKNLSTDQQAQLRELKQTDSEVRTHEQAHKTAGGPYAGAIQLEYTTGPDGRRYATAGEVPIDASAVRGNPEATITKMEIVKRAALAPQNPSPQDRAVAAQADATKAQAQNELREPTQSGNAGTDQSATDISNINDLTTRRALQSYARAASAAQITGGVAISA